MRVMGMNEIEILRKEIAKRDDIEFKGTYKVTFKDTEDKLEVGKVSHMMTREELEDDLEKLKEDNYQSWLDRWKEVALNRVKRAES